MKHTGNAFDTVSGEIFPAREINIRSHDYPYRTFLMMGDGTTPLFNLQNEYFGYLLNENFIKVSMRDTFIGKYPKARKYRLSNELQIDIAYMKHNDCMDSGIVHQKCEQCSLYDPMADITCLCKPARDEYIADQVLKDKLDGIAFRKSVIESHKLIVEEKQRPIDEKIKLKWEETDRLRNEMLQFRAPDTQDIGYDTLKQRKPFWKFW